MLNFDLHLSIGVMVEQAIAAITFPDHLNFILAQQNMSEISKVDILADIQVAFADFMQSGKAGAMMIGIVVGYTVRGITR